MKHDLLIVGSGPYGVALAAYAAEAGIDFRIVGRPFELWTSCMPRGLLLRSPREWHVDPGGRHTIDRFLAGLPGPSAPAAPLARATFVDYLQWFCDQRRIRPHEALVVDVVRQGRGFRLRLDDGGEVDARSVVVATGLAPFQHVPSDLAGLLPAGCFAHAGDRVRLEEVRGRRLLLIGGGQTAFEWAALAAEAGAAAVHVAYRHPTPRFAVSDWSWVLPRLRRIQAVPESLRTLSEQDRSALRARFHAEGRAKLEPWLAPRLDRSEIHPWPESRLQRGRSTADGSLEVVLHRRRGGPLVLRLDVLLFATGYRVDVARLPFLQSLLGGLAVESGYPVLDNAFQSSVAGLFFTGAMAARAFGPCFGFVAGAPVAAVVIGRYLEGRFGEARRR